MLLMPELTVKSIGLHISPKTAHLSVWTYHYLHRAMQLYYPKNLLLKTGTLRILSTHRPRGISIVGCSFGVQHTTLRQHRPFSLKRKLPLSSITGEEAVLSPIFLRRIICRRLNIVSGIGCNEMYIAAIIDKRNSLSI